MKVNKQETEKLAKTLAQRLKNKVGGNWKARVWENGSWCYDAHLGTMSVHENYYDGKRHCFALISSEIDKSSHGLGDWTDYNDSSHTPEKAIINAIKRAENYVDNLKNVLYNNSLKIKS